jgi:diguanylate cyclase (GGDEF)-like protein
VRFTLNADHIALETVPAGRTPSATTRLTHPLSETEDFDLVGTLSSIEETAYVWDLTSGWLDWERNAAEVLGFSDVRKITTGAAYHALIAPEHLNTRLEAFSRSAGVDRARGVPYRVQYRLRPNGQRSESEIRVEDQGRWWPGSDGNAARARGVIRIVPEEYLEQQRQLVRSDFDELTGQLNRVRLTAALAAVLARAERQYQPCAFLMISVNNLPVINETFGIDIGDQVIAEVGRRIHGKLRSGDVIGRYSSNKFGLIMLGCGHATLRAAAERLIKAVRETTIKTASGQLTATISLGGVMIPDQAKSVQDTVNFALRALDIAKTKRFDSFVAHEPSSSSEGNRLRNKSIAESVIQALDENRMRIVLQPMVSTKTGKAEIYEALLRMERPDGSMVSAGEFVPIAERLGLSRLIDRRTLELSVDLLKLHRDLTLSVNVSGLTCSDLEWVTALRRMTKGRPDVLRRMIVEITETVALEELDQSVNFVDTLNELGCRVAIDDFGAGYTSFKNLKRLNVDMVKIDGAFIKNLADDPSDHIFVKTMIKLADTFGMETVAEWVGDERTARLLKDAGITYMQGYYYGKPFDSSDYIEAA